MAPEHVHLQRLTKGFSQEICKILQSYNIACVSILTSKFNFKNKKIHENQCGFTNFSTLKMANLFQTLVQKKTLKIYYFIIKNSGKFGTQYLEKICDNLKILSHPNELRSLTSVPINDHNYIRVEP